jgi:hypothetical protein
MHMCKKPRGASIAAAKQVVRHIDSPCGMVTNLQFLVILPFARYNMTPPLILMIKWLRMSFKLVTHTGGILPEGPPDES